MPDIASRIRQLRGELSQKEFALAISVNMNTLRAYEKGRSLPSSEVLTSICLNFDVNTKWLLLGQGKAHSNSLSQHAQPDTEMPVHFDCPKCDELRDELRNEREEVRELYKENRIILKENGELKAQVATLKGENRLLENKIESFCSLEDAQTA